MMRRAFLAILLVIICLGSSRAATPFQQLRGVIHLDTTVSGGDYEPEEMVRFLIDNDLEVAVFTDHDTVRWDYGFFPARWIMGWITGSLIGHAFGRTGSVQTFGSRNYLALLNELDQKYDKIVVIPGVEAIPFFYWEGSLTGGNLAMVNGYKHLLAFGMPSGDDYEDLPSVGNGFHRGYGIQSLLSLWPLALLFLGLRCRRSAREARLPFIYLGTAFLFLSVGSLFLLNNFPFKFGKYDQYAGDQGVSPYQDLIDYVVDRGGLVFWAHPEVSVDRSVSRGPFKVGIRTESYQEDLLRTHNYTGFAAFYEGMKHVIPPDGIWDQVLLEYCSGARANPVWAIAEGDVEGADFSPKLSQTVFLVRERSREDALQALREGRVYALGGPVADQVRLDGFFVSDMDDSAMMGGTLISDANEVTVSVTLECEPTVYGAYITADLIRDGEVLKTYERTESGVLTFAHRDSVPTDGRTHYYRLDVRAPRQTRLLSNPIFVRSQTAS